MSNIIRFFYCVRYYFAFELRRYFLFSRSVREGSLLSSHCQNAEGSRQGRTAKAEQ